MTDPIEEQARCRHWMNQNGYPPAKHPETADRTSQWEAGRGAEDWLAEEILESEDRSIERYRNFITSRLQDSTMEGFAPLWMPDFLFDFQKYCLDWAVRRGKSALLLDCGMGKTAISLAWAENVVRKVNKPVLVLTPLAVASQFVSEGEKFGIECKRTAKQIHRGINITNYEKLHHFDPADFAGVVADEVSGIRAISGSRRQQVTEFMRTIPYRLGGTATAAPNEFIELGTISEALGILGLIDMLNRFFKNDRNTSDTRLISRHSPAQGGPQSAGWRFKGHSRIPFWRFVCGWSRAGRKPSDLGAFSDERFVLPPLIEREHVVKARTLAPGMLFETAASNMHEEREERQRTIPERCEKAADLVNGSGEQFLIWCNLNPEGDLLEHLIPDAVQIAGKDSDEEKEEKFAAFLSGQSRGLISKHKIAGWGVNAQNCAHVVEFATHSFEAHFQGVRRCYRFGQTKLVINDIIATEGQAGIKDNMQRKARQADEMFASIVRYMHEAISLDNRRFERKVELPKWMRE